MRVVTIAEVLAMGPDEIVPCVHGKITAIFGAKAGTSDKGNWSFQNGEIMDASDKIRITLKDRAVLGNEWKGKTVYITCKQGEKGMTGIKRKDEEYRGQTKPILWVTPTAEITVAAPTAETPPPASSAPPPASPPARGIESTPPTAPPRQQAPSAGKPASDGVLKVRKSFNRLANLYLHAMHAAQYVADTWGVMTPDQFQHCATTLFISADRRMLDADLPIGPFDAGKRAPAPPAPPAPPSPPPTTPAAPSPTDDDCPF